MLTLLGKKIRILRINVGETIVQMSEKLGMSTSYLSSIENGKRNVPVEVLPKLSKIFNLDLKQLEHEYFSEKIAEIIYPQEEPRELLKAAEEKAKYMRIKNQQQGKINF
mgnify:CR=1 FL=1